MTWKKEIHDRNSLEAFTIIGTVFILINFYQNSYLLLFLGVFLIVLSRMSIYYLNHVADHLELENDRQAIRVTVGEKINLPIKISQQSWLPIFHATLRVKLDPIIDGANIRTQDYEKTIEITVPIQIKGKETIQFSLPLIATKRGVTRIKSIELHISNFFNLGNVQLKFNPFIHKEIIIYPTLIPVPQIEQLVATKSFGHYPTASSMYEEVLSPIGTRDYVYSDSFQQIHWKASAKTQVLQTKVFERTADYSWTFIINLREPDTSNIRLRVVENLETIASNVAYMVHYAAKNNIEYEIFLNLNMESGIPVYHLPIGGGTSQLGKAYEILARINRERMTQPIKKLLHYVERQQRNSPVVIICGPFGNDGHKHFAQMQKNGQRVYKLQDDEHNPLIVPLGRY